MDSTTTLTFPASPTLADQRRRERETSILLNDADAVAVIYTVQSQMMRRLRRNPLATFLDVHRDPQGRVIAMEFEIPKAAVTIKNRLPKGHPPSQKTLAALERARTVRGNRVSRNHEPRGGDTGRRLVGAPA